jgi:hypothetical protein
MQAQLLRNMGEMQRDSGIGMRLAKGFRNHLPGTTETYVAYGATQSLVNECIAQADYTIPAVVERNEDPPVNDRGEHVGEARTSRAAWWYSGKWLSSVSIVREGRLTICVL